jgi:O-glycosyl hydrolase
VGGSKPSGGATATGGSQASGGTSGGSTASGGFGPSGGTAPIGGNATGGAGGSASTGGSATTGGTSSGGASNGGTSSGVTVKLDAPHQTIQGFGINDALLSSSWGTKALDSLFGTTGDDAIGLTIMRIGMSPTGDIAGTNAANLSYAKSHNVRLIGSCWSPPAECKSNGKLTQGGYLLNTGTCFADWAKKIVDFAKNQGLYAMSIGNESDFASCAAKGPPCTTDYETTTYTAKQMVEWVKFVGPKLQEAKIKVIAPEASEWIHAWSNISATGSTVASHPNSSDPLNCGCYANAITADKEKTCTQACLDGGGYDYGHWMWKDQLAWKAFDIFGVHEYDSQIAFAWPADVNSGKPDHEVWQTEMSGVRYWPQEGPSSDIANGVAVGGWIHSALTVGEASAWLWWWFMAYDQNDNEGLAQNKNVTGSALNKRYYVLGNYSKFVRPGYVAVEVGGNSNSDVLLSAYKGTDATVIVAVNKGSAAATVPIGFSGGTAPASCTPNVTSAADNLKAGTAVAVTAGTLNAMLPGMTVTSFVCK